MQVVAKLQPVNDGHCSLLLVHELSLPWRNKRSIAMLSFNTVFLRRAFLQRAWFWGLLPFVDIVGAFWHAVSWHSQPTFPSTVVHDAVSLYVVAHC